MYKKKWLAVLAFAAASAILLPPAACAKKHAAATVAASEDDDFLALRDAARNDDVDRADKLADRLGAYAIPSYVDYYRLRPRLFETSASEIRDFLARYEDSAIADRMRNDWLLVLGFIGDWKNFDEQYSLFVQNDDRQVKCYALMSEVAKGQNVADDARLLLTAPKEYGEGCTALIKTLLQNGQFEESDLDMQVRLAAESVPSNVVLRIAAAGDTPDELLQNGRRQTESAAQAGAGKDPRAPSIVHYRAGQGRQDRRANGSRCVERLHQSFEHRGAGASLGGNRPGVVVQAGAGGV